MNQECKIKQINQSVLESDFTLTVAQRRQRGFSLTEILIGTSLLMVFLLGVGTFFLQGNKAAAKGTWRIHTVEKMRLGMSLLRRALDGTAYPSYTSTSNFVEMHPSDTAIEPFDLKFTKSFSKESTTAVTFVAGVDEQIVAFTSVTPYQVDEAGNSVPGSGMATAYSISLEPAVDAKLVTDANQGVSFYTSDLVIEGEEQAYTFTTGGGTATLGTFTPQTKKFKIRIPDVHLVSFRVAKSYPNPEYGSDASTYPRLTLEIYIECRDPFDARLIVTQTMVYMINTQVRGT